MTPRYRIGIDVGGTFTDIFMSEEGTGAIHTHKLSSTPADPHQAPIAGITQILAQAGARGDQVSFIGLGTTVATNALLEAKGARTGLITTRGLRDVLEIGRQSRPSLFDADQRKPPVLVPRALRLEVTERIAADGSVLAPLDVGQLRAAIAELRVQRVQAVAICFLNAFANPCHEVQALSVLREDWPDVHAVTSFQVVPEFREYERFLSTVVNAYLMPAMRDYFGAFACAVAELGIRVPPVIMSSSGGMFTPQRAAARPIDTLFSGPSGGVDGARFLSALAGHRRIVSFDMGGTSTEVCLVRDGRAALSHAREICGYTLRMTAHDIHTIGAGGSSIATVDGGGLLQVGPESAGAAPGPACYGAGAAHATVTDANVVLGRLNAQALLGGRLAIDADRSRAALLRQVAEPKGIDLMAAALAVVELAEANMAQALRVVSVERGLDPKDYLLVALGGAGPLHAASVARQVGMAGVLVPPHPGVLCAMGVLTKDLALNDSRTLRVDVAQDDDCRRAQAAYAEMEQAARTEFAATHAGAAPRFARSAAARYVGQNHEIDIDVPAVAMRPQALAEVAAAFHAAHRELYGYCTETQAVELVTLRLTASVAVQRPRIPCAAPDATTTPPPDSERRVVFDAAGPLSCPVHQRAALPCGACVAGPAIIEQMDTTTVLAPGFSARVDAWTNLVITWNVEASP